MIGQSRKSDAEAERAVLGYLLARHHRFAPATLLRPSDGERGDALWPDDFQFPVHRELFVLIWRALGDKPFNDETAWFEFVREFYTGEMSGYFKAQGGVEWLLDMMRDRPDSHRTAMARMISLSREPADV